MKSFILTVAVLVTPVAVPAQIQMTAPREAAPIQFSSVSLYPRLQIVDAGKDTNVFRDPVDPKEDYTATVSGRLLAVTALGANELLLSAGADYVWFHQYTSERSTDGHYGARFNVNGSRLKPYVGVSHLVTSSRPNPEIDARAQRAERAFLGGLDVVWTARTSLTASAQIDDSTYDEDEVFRGVELAESLNRDGMNVSGGMKYALTPLTTLTVTGNYAKDTFPESHVRDSRSYAVHPTLDFSPDAIIQGQFMLGFEAFRPENEALSDRSGLVGSASLTWTFFGRTNFGLQGGRNIGYSYLDSEEFYLWSLVHLNVTHRLAGPVELVGNLSWDQLSYLESEEATALGIRRKDVARAGGGGVAVTIRGIRLTLTVDRSSRRSNVDPRQNYEGTRVLSSVTIGS